MRRRSLLEVVIVGLSGWIWLAQARPMHSAIEPLYERYLEEEEDVSNELDKWMTKFQERASRNGWIPATESRSSDDVLEDHKQRFFLTKQRISALALENPDANFSTDSPFTLMSDDEFSTYVVNAYINGNSSETTRQRRLHGRPGWGGKTGMSYGFGDLSSGGSGNPGTVTSRHTSTKWSTTTNAQGSTTTTTTTTTTTKSTTGGKTSTQTSTHTSVSTNGQGGSASAGNVNPGSGGAGNSIPGSGSGKGQHHRSWSHHWSSGGGNGWPTGDTSKDQSNAATSAPAATVAPVTAAPVAPTSAPATAAPVATTSAPATAAPAATTSAPVAYEDVSASTTSASTTTADSLDWSTTACISEVQNQGQCGDCWAFATVGAVEAAQCIANGQTSMTKYSEQQLVSCDSRNYGCSGGSPIYALEYVAENGLCTETDFPYTSSGGSVGSSCSSSCTKVTTGVTGSITLTAGDEDELLSTLAQHPVIVAVASGNTAWKQYSGGVLSTCDTTSLDHAVLVVGYDSTSFKIKNSWGDDWGESGYIRLKRGSSGGMGTCGVLTDMYHPDM